jgi:GLPGLI family protein
MKTSGKIFIAIFTLCLIVTSSAFAQKAAKPFKGVITFSMSYSGDIDAATAAQQPKMMVVSVLGNLTKTEINAGPVVIDMITNGDAKTATTLIDMMGQKKYYKMNTAEIDAKIAEEGTPEIKYSEETKVIAGYTCKKAEYITKDADGNLNTTVIYYTEELGGADANYGGQFTGLKGMPLEYEAKQGGVITKISATEVKKGKVKETDFLVPSDYTELTPEEKQQIIDQFSGKE